MVTKEACRIGSARRKKFGTPQKKREPAEGDCRLRYEKVFYVGKRFLALRVLLYREIMTKV